MNAKKFGRRYQAVYEIDESEKRLEEHLASRKRKAKGPNPMSCKKKKIKPNIERPSKKVKTEIKSE